MNKRRRTLFGMLAATALAPAIAQETRFPSRPVRLLVAFPPGGPADIVARLISQRMGEGLGQSVVVENRGGAGGNIAAQAVARGAADGYTVLLTTSAIAIAPGLGSPGFDLDKDLSPVAGVAAQPSVIVAHPGVTASNLQDLMRLAKGGRLNYGSAGNGTSPHLAAEYLFRVLGGVEVQHVPFAGGGPALQAALGGNVELVNVALSPAIPLVRAGKLKAIAVTGAQRSPQLPEVPTVAESGYPGFEDRTWVGLFVPSATPAAAVSRLNAEVERVLQLPDIRERMAGIAFDPIGGTPQAFGQFVKAEAAKFARFIREARIKVE
jgi:tripartite-type tricarboxylate transporter receptor subunit TctC